MKKLLQVRIVLMIVFTYQSLFCFSQGIPEILYYKFNGSGRTLRNQASSPPSGTATASINGILAIGGSAACGSKALVGSGGLSNKDYIETNWKTTTSGSWTISFWTNGLDSSTNLFYLFSDINAGAFRCFSGGVAGAGNLLLRGPFTEVLVTGGASKRSLVTTFVYDSKAGYIYAYINGTLVNSVAQGTIALSTTGTFILSGYNSLEGLNSGALMDEFRFYSRALSASEVQKFTYTGSSTGSTTQTSLCRYTGPSGIYTWNRSGTYKDTIPNSVNCDSIITVNLTITGNTTHSFSATACDFYLSPSSKTFWTKSGIYTDILPNKAGCDSIISVNLTVKYSNSQNVIVNSCGPYTSPSKKYVWTTSGDYVDTLKNKGGCDSTIQIKLNVNSASSSKIIVRQCDSYKSPSGKYTWTVSGSYKDTIPSFVGCDSVISIDLTIIYHKRTSINVVECEKYMGPSKKYTWLKSGIYKDTIPTRAGCDSIITINLTIHYNSSSFVTLKSCEKLKSPSGKYLWTASGIYEDTIKNNAGCDSFMTIDLKINGKTSAVQFKSSCISFISPSKKSIWTKSGKYLDTITNRNGCDSVLTINLTIFEVNIKVVQKDPVLTAEAFGASYQWLDCKSNFAAISGEIGQSFTAKSVGDYAVKVTESGCTDTSVCYTVSKLSAKDIRNTNEINLFPNPTNSSLTITTTQSFNNANLFLIDLTGKKYHLGKHSNSVLEFDISHLAAGVYYLEIQEGSQYSRLRFLKL
jgi:hypothetical protein